jgi:hypothetical protein
MKEELFCYSDFFNSDDLNFHQKFDYPKSFVHITIDIPDV